MSNLQEIERSVSQLSAEELATFRVWFTEFDAKIWDRQFEKDVQAGRLDTLAEKALQHLRAGNCTELWDIAQLLIFGITIDNCQSKPRNWLIDATNFWNKILAIHHYILRRSDCFGWCELEFTIEHWRSKKIMIWHGFGLELMPNMTICCEATKKGSLSQLRTSYLPT